MDPSMDPLFISLWQTSPQTWQSEMQEETDRAVQGILDEDADLDANYPIEEYTEFKKQQELYTDHSRSMPPDTKKKSNEEDEEGRKSYFEMIEKVMELRRKEFERWEDDMERRRKHGRRLEELRAGEKSEEVVMSGRRAEQGETENSTNEFVLDWHLYCRKVRNEARTEKELQIRRDRAIRYERMLERREQLRNKANEGIVIEKVVYCGNKYVAPHAQSPRFRPTPITPTTPRQNLQKETPNMDSTLKEQTFEDIILSSSDEENDQENTAVPSEILNQMMSTPHPSSYRNKCHRLGSSPFRQLRNLNL